MPEKIKEVLRLKVEFWIVLVTLALAVAGTAAGVFTFVDVKEDADAAENNNNNNAGRNDLQVEQRFHGKTGFVENPLLSSADARTRSGYLAVVRHVHSPSVPVLLELIDSNQRKVVHTWDLGPGRVGLVGMGHFHFLADGSVITNQGTSTFRLDACSRVVWRKRLGGHHSIERDADGNFWMPWDRGQATVFGDGGLMVAENHYGRVLMLSAGGEPVWSYINQASDESDGWGPPVLRVRWLDAEYGAQVARSAAARDCGPAAD